MPVGSNWRDIKVDHPPLNGTPVLVCLAQPHQGSYLQVGKWIAKPSGEKPHCVISGMFAFDLPPVLYWQSLPQVPWYEGWPGPAASTPDTM